MLWGVAGGEASLNVTTPDKGVNKTLPSFTHENSTRIGRSKLSLSNNLRQRYCPPDYPGIESVYSLSLDNSQSYGLYIKSPSHLARRVVP